LDTPGFVVKGPKSIGSCRYQTAYGRVGKSGRSFLPPAMERENSDLGSTPRFLYRGGWEKSNSNKFRQLFSGVKTLQPFVQSPLWTFSLWILPTHLHEEPLL
jgi:hypothetical protein